jgi:tetratricopeptide (TPR) repeat protein
MALASPNLLYTLGSYAYDNADYDYSFAVNQLVTRVCRADALPTDPTMSSSPHSTLHRIHLARREFGRAADALELANLGRLKAGYYAQFAMAFQMDWAKVKARALLDAEKPSEAAALMAASVKLNPTDSSMFEDSYQMLVDQGKTTEADALFETAYPRCLAAAEKFPALGQFHNNLAWLLSRTGKKLDQALEHATTATGIEPDNGAFLDTLAEVHFQRGDREKAIAASEKAIEFLGFDAQLQFQLNRFKTGKPTDR